MGIVGIIVNVKASKVYAGPGSFAKIAEAMVDTGTGETTYVTVQEYDGTEYTASKQSVLDFLSGKTEDPAEIDEEYTTLKEAKASVYGPVFEKLRKAIGMLG